ncbi:putative acetyltransferase [Tritrichomonas foetus]|uniref:Acetyltransferase n=1 Tax=Tritrichomonas foetus TaxID=1144522 RepID=A0A1J4JYQ2_9EUKA|nr:putative acetyltransferase [Tritrichomonas foetus]|eukprot:OHT04295.1 putative acetyltransferase [Tritrichomonas foetus]
MLSFASKALSSTPSTFSRCFAKALWHEPKPWTADDPRSEREKMEASDYYKPGDAELCQLRDRMRRATKNFNQNSSVDRPEEMKEFMRELFNKKELPENLFIEPPIYLDYGYNVTIGKDVFINWNVTMLDSTPINIGDETLIGPNVAIYTAMHPISGKARKGPEYSERVTIGKRCWIGGNAVICPGVTIGDNVTVAAGSVVTEDVPSNCIVGGVPAKVLKTLPPEDD